MSRLSSAAAAIACGAAGGCLYLAVMLGTPGALILVYMTQLPLFLAGLWLGAGAAALAGLTGIFVLLAASDLLGAALFAALNAAPVALLVRQALLARRRSDGTLAWYPLGALTAWLTVFALAGIAVAILLLGGPHGLRSALQSVIGEGLDRLARRPLPNRDQVAETLAMVIPGIFAASWMIMVVANGALAQGVLARFGASWRPSPDLAGLGLPPWMPLALGVAAAATLFDGTLRFLGINTMITLSVPFCLAGLAVLHLAVRRLSHPAIALVSFYTLAGLFAWPFLAAAILGLLESAFGLRHRLLPRGVSIDG
ncbi:MAG TPA: DUF2232 domain-containing protein [Stellaceae bacterium]|jgi:hypothetical protein|nr:DUF2232 domain-containing protein [Stellaceae bacterium]